MLLPYTTLLLHLIIALLDLKLIRHGRVGPAIVVYPPRTRARRICLLVDIRRIALVLVRRSGGRGRGVGCWSSLLLCFELEEGFFFFGLGVEEEDGSAGRLGKADVSIVFAD